MYIHISQKGVWKLILEEISKYAKSFFFYVCKLLWMMAEIKSNKGPWVLEFTLSATNNFRSLPLKILVIGFGINLLDTNFYSKVWFEEILVFPVEDTVWMFIYAFNDNW